MKPAAYEVRSGITLMEVIAAIAVATVVVTLIAQTAAIAARLRAQTEAQRHALQTATNVLEIVSAIPYGELLPENATRQAAEYTKAYPDLNIEVQVAVLEKQNEQDLASKQIRVTVQNAMRKSDQAGHSCELVSFIHSPSN